MTWWNARSKRTQAILVIVGLLVLYAIVGPKGTTGTVATATSSPASTATSVVATSAPPATVAPTAQPTATPRGNPKIGQPFTYSNGWKVTVTKLEEQVASRFSTPAPGLRFVTVTIRFDNGGTTASPTNPFYFKLQDSGGIRRSVEIFTDRDDRLSSGDVAPGAFVVGTLSFAAPIGDQRLQLIYEQTGYQQTTFELY